jgi:ABC-2 type transport system permease protein
MLRSPGFAVPVLVLPIGLYLLFGTIFRATLSDPNAARHMLTGFSVFGTVGPALFGFGVALAIEREHGMVKLKRAFPMPPAAYLVAKMFMAMVFAGIVMVAIVPIAMSLGRVPLTLVQIVKVTSFNILGVLPFCALGLLISTAATGRSAPGIVNLFYFPMLYLSGLFFPLPNFLQSAAVIWPTYHLYKLVFAAAGGSPGRTTVYLAYLIMLTIMCSTVALRRLMRED